MAELVKIASSPGLKETGGAHGQKGVEFQRYWVICRMIELASSGVEDFLILIEFLQDVAELDSCTSPSSICLYQVKKKDARCWTWYELTNMSKPGKKQKSKIPFEKSPLGKLYLTLIGFEKIEASGKFVSNSGCDVPLSGGNNAATSLPVSLACLSENYKELIKSKMAELSSDPHATRALPCIYLERVAIHPDDPRKYAVATAYEFLESKIPEHAGQARSLVDSLMAIISPLGTKTDSCSTFEQLCHNRGFSRDQFLCALEKLEKVPDFERHIDDWIHKLQYEGMRVMDTSSIREEIAGIFRRKLLYGVQLDEEERLREDVIKNVGELGDAGELVPRLEVACKRLRETHPDVKRTKLLAYLLIGAIEQCVGQT